MVKLKVAIQVSVKKDESLLLLDHQVLSFPQIPIKWATGSYQVIRLLVLGPCHCNATFSQLMWKRPSFQRMFQVIMLMQLWSLLQLEKVQAQAEKEKESIQKEHDNNM